MSTAARIEAAIRLGAAVYDLLPASVVAIPPSSLDPWPAQIRLRVALVDEIYRPYDTATAAVEP